MTMDNLVYILTKISEGLKGSNVIYFDNDECLSSTLSSIGYGGSKRFFTVDNKDIDIIIDGRSIHDLVIALPNTDVDRQFGHWFPPDSSNIIPMYKLESDISNKLRQVGLLTTNQTSYIIYLKHEEKGMIPIPCYVADSFRSLATKHKMFVIDTKNLNNKSLRNHDHIWSSYQLNLGICEDGLHLSSESINCWTSLCKHYIEYDIPKLYDLGFPRYGDSVNYVMMYKDDIPIVRFFGFDFSSKQCNGVIDPYMDEFIKYSQIDFAEYKFHNLRNLIDYIFFAEYEYGLGKKVYWNSNEHISQILSILIPEELKLVQRQQMLNDIDRFAQKHVKKQQVMEINFKMENINEMIRRSQQQDEEMKMLLSEYHQQQSAGISKKRSSENSSENSTRIDIDQPIDQIYDNMDSSSDNAHWCVIS